MARLSLSPLLRNKKRGALIGKLAFLLSEDSKEYHVTENPVKILTG